MKLEFPVLRHAWHGLVHVVRTQRHALWHALASLAVVGLGIGLQVSLIEWLALILAIGLVWVAEIFNTALEIACDVITKEPHPLIGLAKDVAAGAVLVAAFIAAAVGAVVFVPRFWEMWRPWV
ncbi:diacylglycerol kinase family protein [Verrucomicrobium spinosum]|uniref:diacylglycerol kinase family protein n=1 Tax=Verrucomicrobium spinosum TaxID=2736 RepID=UPI0001745AB6|nr:diacylglycerol kinase family protein [Verrucomicrobium spinosum]